MTSMRQVSSTVVFVTSWLIMATTAYAESIDTRPESAEVIATGQAPVNLREPRQAAIEDALRRCVEAGAGVALTSTSAVDDFALIRDAIYTRTAGYVQRYEVLEENPDQQGLYTVRVRAVVKRGSLDADLAAWKLLLARKGQPRLMVVGMIDGAPLDELIAQKIRSKLEARGVTVVHTRMRQQHQRDEAQRIAHGQNDPELAAHVATEAGADYLVIFSVRGHALKSDTVYGISLHRAEGEGAVEIVQSDTAVTLASEVVHGKATATSASAASRRLIDDLLTRALDRALRRLSTHWLEDLDPRHGQSFELVIYRLPFEKIHGLADQLRRTSGITQVLVDSIHEQSLSRVRLVTHAAASDVGHLIKQIDPNLHVSVGNYRLEIRSSVPVFSQAIVAGGLSDSTILALAGAAVAMSVFVLVTLMTRRRHLS